MVGNHRFRSVAASCRTPRWRRRGRSGAFKVDGDVVHRRRRLFVLHCHGCVMCGGLREAMIFPGFFQQSSLLLQVTRHRTTTNQSHTDTVGILLELSELLSSAAVMTLALVSSFLFGQDLFIDTIPWHFQWQPTKDGSRSRPR